MTGPLARVQLVPHPGYGHAELDIDAAERDQLGDSQARLDGKHEKSPVTSACPGPVVGRTQKSVNLVRV